jgi:hypothetical protein
MFVPDRQNGIECRARVLARLAGSLAHIAKQVDGTIPFDPEGLRVMTNDLCSGTRQKPELFAYYFQLVASIQADDHEQAERCLHQIASLRPPMNEKPVLRRFSATTMSAVEMTLLRRHISVASLDGAELLTLEEGAGQTRAAQIDRAMSRLASFAPGVHAEFGETIGEIILASGSTNSFGYTFDGASSLEYWGAILINVSTRKSDLEVIEMLAHEAAHNVLFGLSPTQFFVTNLETERYSSPLRPDPRPLDGIYHATFVLARMHYAISALIENGGITSQERAEATDMLQRSAGNFHDAKAILDRHASYTGPGAAIMSEASAYMAAAGRLARIA